ncbi:transferrin-binding protein-like solute binding protein [Providencia sp. R33]|uniref:Slam-dependent surface lipoprotein n=1 Tax=Providencia sp. R33 TaxID=2828763 RepID=UPI001C5AB255|nr:Slam-dependent surface lipoprotein [Providencia sp. R33]QXX84319.1 transferrin-binding protein-like solute binding protein [Providencia sp. R33]
MKKLTLVVLMASLSGASTSVFAEATSQQSQSYTDGVVDIRIDKTEAMGGPHGGVAGTPGIGYRGTHNGKTIAFSGLKGMATQKPDDVYQLESSGGRHVNMGKFQFSQVADAEIYYGDWSQTGVNGDSTHTAYFSGNNASTEVPTNGSAVYNIEGVNQFDGEGKLTGTFNVDFGQKSYVGLLEGNELKQSMEGDVFEDGKFKGTAEAISHDSLLGDSMGQFFGDNAEHVAGITSFKDNHELDTAFGGKKAD